MKLFFQRAPCMSKAMHRIEAALAQYAPNTVNVVHSADDADMIFLHTIGFPETVAALNRWSNKKVVIAQYCVRTTQQPHTADWLAVWERAHAVWSYYDLRELTRQDGLDWALRRANLIETPIGVDGVFHTTLPPERRTHLVMTSGYVAATETVDHVSTATQLAGGTMLHLGPPVVHGSHVKALLGVDDTELRRCYHLVRYVSGLRRIEGFELPAAESLICGARPIMFDRPHYRRWFDGLAEFIPETTDTEIVAALYKILQVDPWVSEAERAEARARFNWREIAAKFWRGVR